MVHTRLAALALTGLVAGTAQAAMIGVDGSIGAEWGAPTATVGFDSLAATSNFGAPGNTNHNVGYSIYLRTDGTYLYGAVAAAGATNGLDFANLYFNIDGVPGSDFGIEVTNDRFFKPGVSGYTADSMNLLTFAIGAGVIEFALDWSVLVGNVYGMPITPTAPGGRVVLNLSQSFGYSVAGGQSNYGDNRLGAVNAPASAPEPGVLALVGLALGGLALMRRRV